jgi:hypothetical protein
MPYKDPETRKAYLREYAKKHPAYARVKAWRKANPEKRAEHDAVYAAAHPGKAKERQQRYLEKHAEKILVKDREVSARYRAKHPERVAASKKQYAQTNKGKVNAAVAKRAATKLKQTPSWLTEDDYWVMEQAYELATLRTKLFGFAWHVDHIVPLQGELVSGFHTPCNLQVIPALDNLRKGNRLHNG